MSKRKCLINSRFLFSLPFFLQNETLKGYLNCFCSIEIGLTSISNNQFKKCIYKNIKRPPMKQNIKIHSKKKKE